VLRLLVLAWPVLLASPAPELPLAWPVLPLLALALPAQEQNLHTWLESQGVQMPANPGLAQQPRLFQQEAQHPVEEQLQQLATPVLQRARLQMALPADQLMVADMLVGQGTAVERAAATSFEVAAPGVPNTRINHAASAR